MAVDYVAKYTLKFNNLAGRGLLSAGRMADALGKRLRNVSVAGAGALAAVGGAAIALTSQYAKATDDLAKFSKRVEISIGTIQALEHAIGQQGGSTEGLRKGLDKMSKTLGEAKAGTGALYTLLSKTDRAFLKQLQSVSDNEEAFKMLTRRIAETEDVQKRAALSQAAFGRAGKEVLNLTSDGMENVNRLMREASELRPPITPEEAKQAEEYKDAVARLKLTLTGYADIIAKKLLPHMTRAADAVKDFLVKNRELVQTRVDEFIKRLSDKIKQIDFAELAEKAGEFKDSLGKVVSRVGELVSKAGGLKTLVKVFAGLWAFVALGKVATAVLAVSGAMKGLAIGIRVVGIALVANPIGLIIAGIATAAVGAFLIIRKHWDKIGPLVDRVASWFMGMYEQAKPIIDALGQVVVNVFGIISNVVRTHLQIVGRIMSAVWSGAQKVVSVSVNSIKGAVNLLKAPFNAVVGWGKALGQGLGSVWTGIKDGATSMVNYIRDKINAVMDKLKAAAEAGARLRDKILAGLGNDAAQRRIEEREQRDREEQAQRASEAGVTPQGGLNYMYGAFGSQAPTLVPAPETHLTVINEADGGIRVEKRVGNEGSVTNLPHQPNSRVTF